MVFDRREMLRMGAIGAGGLMISSAASSVGIPLTNMILPPITHDPLAPLPAPVSAAPAGVNPQLFQRAKAALAGHGSSIRYRDTIGVVDFSLPSAEPRFHLINLASGQVDSFRVAHGSGSDPDHSGFVERFSNDFGSHATSNGTYITADTYDGKYGLSMKVDGLDWTNNNANARAIVIHNAWYAEDNMIPAHGKLGRSEGCFAFSRASQWQVMSRLAGGRMIYADKLG
ncbi:MAG: murein L,D-transpeptidase catalytic domain family protein [Sphingomicrobium sp.]